MTGWRAERAADRSARTVIFVSLLALLLVAAVPVALLAGMIMMMLGHVAGGLAVFGGSVLVAALAVVLAGVSGLRQMRKLAFGRAFPVMFQNGNQESSADAQDSDYADAVRLDPSQYDEVR